MLRASGAGEKTMRNHRHFQSTRTLFALSATALVAPTAFAGLLLPTVWDGSCNNQFWHSVCGVGNGLTNWNDDNIPTVGTQVSIPMGSPAVSIVTNAACSSIDCQSGLTIEGGALEMAGSSTIHNLTIDSVSLFGLQIDAGDVLLETSCDWISGRMTGAGNVKNRGLMTGNPNVQGTGTFFNQSTATLKGMTIGPTAAAVERNPDFVRKLRAHAMEAQSRQETHHTVGNRSCRENQTVVFGHGGTGKPVSSSRDPFELARMHQTAEGLRVDAGPLNLLARDRAPATG